MSVSPATDLDPIIDPDSPAVVHADAADAPLDWLQARREALRTAVTRHGALLVRGLQLSDRDTVAQVFATLGAGLSDDTESFAPRRHHGQGVYSSAAWPDHQPMCMHHELSYRRQAPALAQFACLTAPASGGVTGLADAAAVLADLPEDLVRRCTEQGWLLRRTFGGDIGPSVQAAFGTDDHDRVESYCRSNDIEVTWQADGTLRTQQRRPAVITHPVTGARCWFNQIAFLSEWTIEEEIREFMIDMYGEDGLPFATAYGDGTPIEAEVIETLNAVYERRTVREPWQAGDLLLVDNLATAHSREPFTGEREILVGLSDLIEPAALALGGSW